MPKIAVHMAADESSLPQVWLSRIETLDEMIRCKSYELFEAEDKPHGRDLDHWLEAERLILTGNGELKSSDDGYEVLISVPGFVASEIEVQALPHSLLVHAESMLKDPNEETTNCIVQRYDLSEPIDSSKVSAHLEKGVLQIIAPKVTAAKATLTHAATA